MTDHPLVRLETVVLVAVGGAVGANARYLVGSVVSGLGGTFVANVLGSFLLGFLLYEAVGSGLLAGRTRTVLGTGFLSSFTTYSTFALESLQAGVFLGTVNVGASYACGFVGVLLGRAAARTLEER